MNNRENHILPTPFGRDEEIDLIQNGCSQPIFEEGENGRVFFFHGISGVGKTTLYQYAQEHMVSPKSDRIPICLSAAGPDTDIANAHRTIRHIYNVLRTNVGFQFPHYELACAYLCKEQNMTTGIYQIDNPSVSTWDNIKGFVNTVLGIFPVGGLLAYAGEKLIELIKGYRNTQHQQKAEEDIRRTITNNVLIDIGEHLVDYFIQDFNESIARINSSRFSGHNYVVIAIDAFEKRPKRNTPQDYFTNSLIPGLHWTNWLLFSTEESLSIIKPNINVMSVEVHSFMEEKTREFLCIQGINEPQAQEKIVAISQGLPAAIRILETIYSENPNQFVTNMEDAQIRTYGQLFNYYFINHIDEQRRFALECMTVFDYWNYSIVCSVFDEYHSEEIFIWLRNNTALVTPCTNEGDGCYCFVSIVREAMQSVLKQNALQNRALKVGNKGKYRYYRRKVEENIKRIREYTGERIPSELYDGLIKNSEQAFRGAVNAYSDRDEFVEYSTWCLETEQFLTTISFFDLKAKLISIYLEQIGVQDNFHFDTEETRFHFRMLRDQEWAYLYSGQWQKAIYAAEKYREQTVSRYGDTNPHVPFALYLCGLAYQRICNTESAKRYLNGSINLETELSNYIAVEELHPDSTYPVTILAWNALGALGIDAGQYSEAETTLLQMTGAREKLRGDASAAYENLSKLYFYWSWFEAREHIADDAGRHLALAEEYLNRIDNLGNNKVKRCSAETRRITLSLAHDFLEGITPNWATVCEQLTQIKVELENLYQPQSTNPLIYCIVNNIAVLNALQGKLTEAKEQLTVCMVKKNIYYNVPELEANKEDAEDPIRQFIQNKTTLRDTRLNLEAIEKYINSNGEPVSPYDFILQY